MQKVGTSLPSSFFRRNQKRLFDLADEILQPVQGELVLLSGPVTTDHFDDDALSYVFPEPLYYYLTGICEDPDTYAVLNLKERQVVVFSKEFDPAANYWQKLKKPEDFKREFEVDDALYLKELPAYLNRHLGGPSAKRLFLYKGTNPYSNNTTLNPEQTLADILKPFLVNLTDFYEVACEARVIKSAEEVEALRRSADLAVYVHQQILKQVRPGMSELNVSNLFSSIRTEHGSGQPYHNIVCAGPNAAYLHYSPSGNCQAKEGDLLLIDAGCLVDGYSSDVTRTFPVSGKFSSKQADLYGIVFQAHQEALKKIRPGVNWLEVHITAEKAILKGLSEKGLVRGDLEEMWVKRVSYYFMPHGVGHYIGLYTHDLPGLKSKENNWTPIKQLNLRVKRILESGMVLTVEPGIYFNQALLDAAFNDPVVSGYFDKARIQEYQKEVGGIRLEDMVAVAPEGPVVLSEGLPRSVAEIEEYMKK